VYCSKCGTEISAATTFCPTCGQPTLGGIPATPATPATIAPSGPGTFAPAAPSAPAYYSSVQYAGFWLRLVAYLIDSLLASVAFVILLIPILVFSGVMPAIGRISRGEDPADVFALISSILVAVALLLAGAWLYYALLESSSWQGTVGKRALNLKVTDMSGNPVTFGRASGRFFSRFITELIPLKIGYILAGFTEKKQAIHDMIASCLVLRNV
jgi:uncharacterized RDD family membrane protein YckC